MFQAYIAVVGLMRGYVSGLSNRTGVGGTGRLRKWVNATQEAARVRESNTHGRTQSKQTTRRRLSQSLGHSTVHITDYRFSSSVIL